MLILSHNELKKIAKSRGIKVYKNIPKDKFLNISDKKLKKMKLKELFMRHEKNDFKRKIMKKTIEPLYTPSKKQSIK